MVQPRIVERSAHTISRRQIDPDALRVMYRLRKFNHLAYLVGGGVRDLLLGRHPKDFDIGTSAHPHEIKRVFRNCWIIGRRFRLAHVRFGAKTIEVATFRRQLPPEAEAEALESALLDASAEPPGAEQIAQPEAPAEAGPEPPPADVEPAATPADRRARRPIRQDNVFGTPEQDAFRRDFTVNALFYDVGTFSIIDYVGGLEDLRAGLVRSIGDPNERFVEDPVRMLRAIALAARLDFRVDPPIYAAIARHRGEIAHSSPARLLEELYKILRSGAGERTFKGLAEVGLLEPIAREIHEHRSLALWQSLAELDMYRSRFDQAPDALTNPILLGSLVAPTQELTAEPRGTREGGGKRPLGVTLGVLPVARRDVDRLRHLLALQERLRHPDLPGRAQQALRHRSAFAEAFTWLEIHGRSPDLVAQWRSLTRGEPLPAPTAQEHALDRPSRRRRRRRRRPRPAPAA